MTVESECIDLIVFSVFAVRVQGEKHQEEKSQHRGVCRWRQSQPQEEEKSKGSFSPHIFVCVCVYERMNK